MKIAVIGSTGRIGKLVVMEERARGHDVLGILRAGAQAADPAVPTRPLDIFNSDTMSELIAQNDVLISAYRAPAEDLHLQVVLARIISTAASIHRDRRCVFIGAVSSLEISGGVKYLDSPKFPAEYRTRGIAHEEAVDTLRSSPAGNWTVLAPPEIIGPSAPPGKEGCYRWGTGQLLRDTNGASTISFADFARAVVDEVEDGRHPRSVVSVAY